MDFPRIVWMYWHQGWHQAPYLVKKCFESWKKHHPEWQVIALDKHTIYKHIDPVDVTEEKFNNMPVKKRANLLRIKLLIEYGGVWADATCYCMKPLDTWLNEYMGAGVFMFQNPGRDRLMANWFIASEQNNYLLKKLLQEQCIYWSEFDFEFESESKQKLTKQLSKIINRRPLWTLLWFTPLFTKWLKLTPMFIFHYHFYKLLREDDQFAAIWKDVPEYPAREPVYLLRCGLNRYLSKEAKDHIISLKSPLYKLNWKLKDDSIPKGSTLDFLLHEQSSY